jgi:hypothetical protein
MAGGAKRTKLEEMLDEKRKEFASLSPQRDAGRVRQLERETDASVIADAVAIRSSKAKLSTATCAGVIRNVPELGTIGAQVLDSYHSMT